MMDDKRFDPRYPEDLPDHQPPDLNRSIQDIIRECVEKIVVPTGPADWLVYYGPNGETTALIENRKTATAIVLRTIAEVVEVTGTRTCLQDIAAFAEVFAGDIGSRGPSQREALVGDLRVKHVIAAERALQAFDDIHD